MLMAVGAASAAEPPTVVGKIGGIELKAVDIRESLAGLDAARRDALSRDPAALSQYVRALLVQRLVLENALEERWDQRPDVISKLVRVREETLAETYLESASAPPEGYPSEDEVKAAYEIHKGGFRVPKSYHLAQVFVTCPAAASSAEESGAKARLDGFVKRLAAKGADFAGIAREASEDPASAKEGGDLGWLSVGQIVPEIANVLTEMKSGSVSKPIRTRDGWHILKVIGIREEREATLAEVRDELVTNLKLEKRRIKRQEYVSGLLKKHPLAINEIELLKSVAPVAE
jgi:PPIC-type PPIASE domain